MPFHPFAGSRLRGHLDGGGRPTFPRGGHRPRSSGGGGPDPGRARGRLRGIRRSAPPRPDRLRQVALPGSVRPVRHPRAFGLSPAQRDAGGGFRRIRLPLDGQGQQLLLRLARHVGHQCPLQPCERSRPGPQPPREPGLPPRPRRAHRCPRNRGWRWGAHWRRVQDWQHFEARP